ncbi:MAG TPA: serine/threonine-protein kinase, partial [Verrucomicrobiae bacterium]|nr:serine/threonine-protein kinase [Verrucomicrobiae bacterium]
MNHEETILEQALGIDAQQARDEFLRGACGDDEAMFARLQGLLRAHERAGKFLEHSRPSPASSAASGVPSPGSAAPETAQTRTPSLLSEHPGDRIGRYKLLQKIGEGGCGVVYMAEQQEPVRRRVALKIIKLGMDTRSVVARFEAERQALAMMDHPNIARVFDAGATGTSVAAERMPAATLSAGRPYFVMELVRGVKITTYCDEQQLSTRQRLDLFIQVCQAVQHAHQKGIIHRDLKPSNILVTEQDGAPVPKIIDFGIAKATTDQRLTDKTLFTAFEQFIGTPAYMSPEQAGLGGLDIDTRSDIYSLGVLLYELLTGKPPFDSERLARSALDELLRTIRETEPPRPSARLTTLTEQELTSVAQRRQTEAAKLSNLVRGDLDWIVMKALDKDRRRRYDTANGLARDLERYLGNEPVVARPPTATYRLKKLVRRNKVAFAAGAVILVTLVLGVVMSTWQTVLATRARADAQAAAKEAQEARISEANQRKQAIAARDAAQEQEMRARERLYLANITSANEALQKGHLGRARELVQKAAEAATITAPRGEQG